jgi:hypothetical protein
MGGKLPTDEKSSDMEECKKWYTPLVTTLNSGFWFRLWFARHYHVMCTLTMKIIKAPMREVRCIILDNVKYIVSDLAPVRPSETNVSEIPILPENSESFIKWYSTFPAYHLLGGFKKHEKFTSTRCNTVIIGTTEDGRHIKKDEGESVFTTVERCIIPKELDKVINRTTDLTVIPIVVNMQKTLLELPIVKLLEALKEELFNPSKKNVDGDTPQQSDYCPDETDEYFWGKGGIKGLHVHCWKTDPKKYVSAFFEMFERRPEDESSLKDVKFIKDKTAELKTRLMYLATHLSEFDTPEEIEKFYTTVLLPKLLEYVKNKVEQFVQLVAQARKADKDSNDKFATHYADVNWVFIFELLKSNPDTREQTFAIEKRIASEMQNKKLAEFDEKMKKVGK